MGQTREQKIIKQVVGKPTTQKFTPIATDMFLPNHSGIASHPEFKKALSNVIIPSFALDPADPSEGTIILNTTENTLKIYYASAWRTLHTFSLGNDFLLLEIGDYILLETGDKIIL